MKNLISIFSILIIIGSSNVSLILFSPVVNAQAPTYQSNQKCQNGLNKFQVGELKDFNFCYDSATTVVNNIRNANDEDRNNHYQLTKNKNISKTGEVIVTKGNQQLIFKYLEGSTSYLPQVYCTANNISQSIGSLGSIVTARSAVIDIQPTNNLSPMNEYSEDYNNKRDKENNILYPTDPTQKLAGVTPNIYNPSNNIFLDSSINGSNTSSKEYRSSNTSNQNSNQTGNQNNTTDIGDRYKDTKYPFLLIPQGFKLPYTSDKDQKINKTRKLDRNTNDITKYGQKLIETKAQQEESAKINEELQIKFKKGEGTCFDNNHKLFGIRLDNETIINDKHSSGYNINEEADDQYHPAINPEIKKINSGTAANSTSILQIGIPSIKIYSNSNELSTLSDTLESICWNRISCERRDRIILRPESGDFSYPRNPLTKNSDGSRAKTQLDGKTEQQRAEEEKKKAE
ncbi:MAG: hypothetical protein ACRCXZ_04150, partial [Patescibacteria group bacterium]